MDGSSSKDALFDGLPPPSASIPNPSAVVISTDMPAPVNEINNAPIPSILKAAATKRSTSVPDDEGSKRVRFKTTTEASPEKVIEAMQKIANHIANPLKFSKASKLALQLLEAGSVTTETSNTFFEVLRAAMSSPTQANEASVRADYHKLFSAVQEKADCFSVPQQGQLEIWLIWAVTANDFFTDDTFVFSKAASNIKQGINSLPEMAEEDNKDNMDQPNIEEPGSLQPDGEVGCCSDAFESDPFGLNALLPNLSKKEEKARKRKVEAAAAKHAQEVAGTILRERRDALLQCLKLMASRYRNKWAQTIIDITAKHAYDNKEKFSISQQDAIEKLWLSVYEQQIKRKQGKGASGSLDITPFERLQHKYAGEKISIRKAVGASGDRSAEQWLG